MATAGLVSLMTDGRVQFGTASKSKSSQIKSGQALITRWRNPLVGSAKQDSTLRILRGAGRWDGNRYDGRVVEDSCTETATQNRHR